MTHIEFKDINFAYDREGDPVIRRFNLTVPRGQFLIIAGRNGSGKSTLLRLVNGLVKAQSGTIAVNGYNPSHPDHLPLIRRQTGMVFQEPENQIASTVVEEDVAFGPENLNFNSREMKEAVDRALRLTGMSSLRSRATTALSAGQQQKLALAGVLAMSPQCLLLDEPTSMLNPGARADMMDLITSLHRKSSLTVLMVTHHQDEILRGERMIILDQGVMVRDGLPREILTSDQLEDWGLLPPPALKASRMLREDDPLFPDCVTPRELSEAMARTDKPELRDRMRRFWPLRESPASREKPIIRFNDVNHSYLKGTRMEQKALKNLDLSLPKGQTTFLLGSTGSGKSTLLQHMNGLLLPQGGSVIFDTTPLVRTMAAREMAAIRRRAGLVMQRPEKQLFERYLGDDVAFAPRRMGREGKDLSRTVRKAMERAGLPFSEFKDRPCYALSGGEKRKAALAGVLAMEPEVLLLDEPSSGLDPVARDTLHRLLSELSREGITLVIASHDMDEAALLADRVVLLDRGRVAAQGTPNEIFSQTDLLRSLGLALPFIKEMEVLCG